MEGSPFDFFRRLMLWTVVCAISAGPSFYWAAAVEYSIAAMVVGVVLFIIAFTVMTSTRRFARFRARPFVRRTLYIGYGLRMLVSIIFPAGMMIDMFPGLFSIYIVQSLGVPEKSFFATLMITLIQGTLLNTILSVIMLVVWGSQRLLLRVPEIPEHVCAKCGYDLRGNQASGRCPECGTSHEAESPAMQAAA